MNKYVIAYLSLFDGEIHQMIIEAFTPLEAMNRYLETSFETEEEIYDYSVNSDSYINYLEIK